MPRLQKTPHSKPHACASRQDEAGRRRKGVRTPDPKMKPAHQPNVVAEAGIFGAQDCPADIERQTCCPQDGCEAEKLLKSPKDSAAKVTADGVCVACRDTNKCKHGEDALCDVFEREPEVGEQDPVQDVR